MVSEPDLIRDSRFAEGLGLYATGKFFESHEVLEDLWRDCAVRDRLFVQALIHLAVAQHHWSVRNREGTLLQMDKCARKLAGYLPEYANLPAARIYRAVVDATGSVRDGGSLPFIEIAC
jgi:predicted metal-dependent hydrolase